MFTVPDSPVITVPSYRQNLGTTPLIFLAGPIKNAPNWQAEAISIFLAMKPQPTIANPRGSIRGTATTKRKSIGSVYI